MLRVAICQHNSVKVFKFVYIFESLVVTEDLWSVFLIFSYFDEPDCYFRLSVLEILRLFEVVVMVVVAMSRVTL